MDRIPKSPPKVNKIDDSVLKRPLWSVMIPVYNCSDYLIEAIESVLSQDPGRDIMQIMVVDDASTDANVEKIVNEVGKGRVSYFRQPANKGSLINFQTCINLSTGLLIHLLHGDDRLKPGFYEKMGRLFKDFPEAGAAFCNYTPIDHKGNQRGSISGLFGHAEGYLQDPLYVIGVRHPTQYVSMVVKRSVYEDLGSFYGVCFGEDWEMWTRIAKNYPVVFTPDNLAEYRRTPGSITMPKIETGQNPKDLAATIKRVEAMLPKKYVADMDRNRKWCAKMSLTKVRIMIEQNRPWEEIAPLLHLAFEMNPTDPKTYWRILKLSVKHYGVSVYKDGKVSRKDLEMVTK
jgi:glycosyltransferase involved in cell wall biosynthesis